MSTTPQTLSLRAGQVLVALCALHILATLGGAGASLVAMIQAGWWRTADPMASPDWMQVAVFWSLLFGALMGFMGRALWRHGRGDPPLSRLWGVSFAIVCGVGALAVPAGGFWFGLGLGLWIAAS